MDRLNLSRGALSVYVAGALLAGCGGSQPPNGTPAPMPQIPAAALARAVAGRTGLAWSYKVLHRFSPHRRHPSRGEGPSGGLLDFNGTLYGTTTYGGKKKTCILILSPPGCGIVYSVSTTGAYRVLYSFHGGMKDGAQPGAGLTNVNGTLYGTTITGGITNSECTYIYTYGGCGTVYRISTTGVESVLYRFAGFSDGAFPTGHDLTDVDGTLYGTTIGGGSSICLSGCGTVFSITTSGTEKVVHSFVPGSSGDTPTSGLTDVDGTMYGTTGNGGSKRCTGGGCGTLYSLTPSGNYKVLHYFKGGSEGDKPSGDLIDVNGVLYGTTARGGDGGGFGTVYRFTRRGKEKVLYAFKGGTDGAGPTGGLIDVNGTLYGTTTQGGGYDCAGSTCGTVYSVTTTGKEKVLYRFTGGVDGWMPDAPLINMNGILYGTTNLGGSGCGGFGCGVVFSLSK